MTGRQVYEVTHQLGDSRKKPNSWSVLFYGSLDRVHGQLED
jgi:hypothetical protein